MVVLKHWSITVYFNQTRSAAWFQREHRVVEEWGPERSGAPRGAGP